MKIMFNMTTSREDLDRFDSRQDLLEMMDGFDPAALLPQLETIFEKMELICRIAVMVGPVVLLIMGLVVLLWGWLNHSGNLDGVQGWLHTSTHAEHVKAQDKFTAEVSAAAEKAAAEKAAAEAKARAAADEKEAALQDRQTAELRQKEAADNRKAKEAAAKAAEAERETARLKAKAAADAAKTAADEKEKAKALENVETAKAAAEADKLAAEKLRSEKVIAEAKALELQKIDFETWQRNLVELKQELEERERALQPEKTIADLAWVGGMDDKIVGADGTLTTVKKETYLAENDRTLPKASRYLAKTERIVSDSEAGYIGVMRTNIVAQLESLYIQALKEERVVDAEYYKANLKSLYPDWEFKGEINKNGNENKK
jgi:hypothetical protein